MHLSPHEEEEEVGINLASADMAASQRGGVATAGGGYLKIRPEEAAAAGVSRLIAKGLEGVRIRQWPGCVGVELGESGFVPTTDERVRWPSGGWRCSFSRRREGERGMPWLGGRGRSQERQRRERERG